MLFTSAHIPPNTTPSVIFRERKNGSDGPAKLGEISIYVITDGLSLQWKLMASSLGQVISSTFAHKILSSEDEFFSFLNTFGTTNTEYLIRSYPPVGVSFRGEDKETLDAAMNSIGFVKEAKGRISFYRGVVTMQNAKKIAQFNPDLDTYVPFGTTTLRGYLAFVMTCKLVHGWATV